MLNITNYLLKHKRILIKDDKFKPLFEKNLSHYKVRILSTDIFDKCKIEEEPIPYLYHYTYHVLDNSYLLPQLRLQCTAYNVYVQHQEFLLSINLSEDTIVYYYDEHLYLAHNRIVVAVGTIRNHSIHWSNTITFYDSYMKLPKPDILPDDNQILPTIILHTMKSDL